MDPQLRVADASPKRVARWVRQLVHAIIVRRRDALATVETEAGVPLATNLLDGSRMCGADFVDSFEFVERHGHWLEAVMILSDDGFGVALFVPDIIEIDPDHPAAAPVRRLTTPHHRPTASVQAILPRAHSYACKGSHMLHLYDRATMAHVLTLDLDPRLHRLLADRLGALGEDLIDWTGYVVVCAGETENDILSGIGLSPLVETIDGNPQQNGFVESFNGRLRDECLNEHLFPTPAAARRIIEAWRTDYNTRTFAQQPWRVGTRRVNRPPPPGAYGHRS